MNLQFIKILLHIKYQSEVSLTHVVPTGTKHAATFTIVGSRTQIIFHIHERVSFHVFIYV